MRFRMLLLGQFRVAAPWVVTRQAFYHWGQSDPEQGVASLLALTFSEERAEVVDWLALGWLVSGERGGFEVWRRALDPASP